MFFSSIRWQLAIPYILLILLATLGITLYTSSQIKNSYLEELESHLLVEARLVAESIHPLWQEPRDTQVLENLPRHWAIVSNKRVTLLNASGTVLASSYGTPETSSSFYYYPEVKAALETGTGMDIRFCRPVGYEAMYIALRVTDQSKVQGFVHISASLREVDEEVELFRQNVLSYALLATVLVTGLTILITGRIITPISRLTDVAERLAKGDLHARLIHTGSNDEVAQLSRAFNYMADQLRNKVAILNEEQSQLSAVLENMADGVLITDTQGQVILINPSAARILQTTEDKALGHTFAQVVYHHQLIKLWKLCQATHKEQTQAVETGPQGIFIQVIITPLKETGTRRFLVILQDLTRIRRLETVRRDFISNISHELRTPLASLKVVVETLLDGAIEDPPAAERFLNHIDTEVNVLTQIVQELLELSRIESGKVPINTHPTTIQALLNHPIERLSPQAERAGLTLTLSLPDDTPLIQADPERIRQVITNLVHNAIKFTPPGGTVTVSADTTNDTEIVVAVRDTGVGIPQHDLARIFERFYKADRARSGGGTGLGLAIAKHIVQKHQGRIWAESVEGKGSTFYFTLPYAR